MGCPWLMGFLFFEAHCYNISQWGPGGEKTASLLQNTSNTFPISAVQFFLLKLSTLQALKIVKEMMISGGSKSPLVVTSPQRLQLCLSEQQAIGELP